MTRQLVFKIENFVTKQQLGSSLDHARVGLPRISSISLFDELLHFPSRKSRLAVGVMAQLLAHGHTDREKPKLARK